MPLLSKLSQRIPVPDDMTLPFKLGDLVLCRYSLYPYWPATIAETHQAKFKGKHVCMIKSTKDDENGLLSFWCIFTDEDTGGWVRADKMVKYHPDLVPQIRLEHGSNWSKEQNVALRAADRHYKMLMEGSKPPPKPTPPDDFFKPWEDPNKVGRNEINDGREPEPARPAKKQKISDGADPSPSVAMKNKLDKAEKDLAAAEVSNAKLKEALRKRELCLSKFTNNSSSVRILLPPTPENIEVVIPAANMHHSKPVDSERFSDMMSRLNTHFEVFKENAKAEELARIQLLTEKKKFEDVLKDLSAKVTESAQVAVDREKLLVGLLEEILEAKVDVEDLRKHKAGNVVGNIGKICIRRPSIAAFCNEIYAQWKKQALAYIMETGDGKKAISKPKGKTSKVGGTSKDKNGKGTEMVGDEDTLVFAMYVMRSPDGEVYTRTRGGLPQ